MKHYILITLTFLMSLQIFSQDEVNTKRKTRFPAWITHSKNTDIVGLSIGALPKDVFGDSTLTRTFGIRIEAPGFGVLAPLMPNSPVSKTKSNYLASTSVDMIEKIYGINLSSGTFGDNEIYGVSGALMMQYIIKMNGFSLSTISNMAEKHNGVAVSFLGNESYKTNGMMISGIGNESNILNGIQISALNSILEKGRGIQIGLWNEAKNFRGIQFGLWNKNDKRSLPLINWQFKS